MLKVVESNTKASAAGTSGATLGYDRGRRVL